MVHEQDSWRGVDPTTELPAYNPEPPLLAAKFAKKDGYRHILAVANEDGKVAIQNVEKRNTDGPERAVDGHQCHHNAVFDTEWMPNEMKLITVSGDHAAKLWDVTDTTVIETKMFCGHERSVKTVAFRQNDSAVFATGGRDGAIMVWDTRAQINLEMMPRADNCILSGHAGGPGTPVSHRKRTRLTPKLPAYASSSSITGLVFQDDNTLISCGAGDGLIKVWDMRRNYSLFKREPQPKHCLPYPGTSTLKGFTNLITDRSGLKLYASCMDNNIYCYNIGSYSGQVIQTYSGAKISSFYIKSCLSPDDQYLLSGSSDGKAYIWNVNNAKPVCTLNGHHSVEVTCVAWCHSPDFCLVTCSEDARHKIWRLPTQEVTDDVMPSYRGQAELNPNYHRSANAKRKLKLLQFTPRSVKRFKNEQTPTTSEEKNVYGKRSISATDESVEPEAKRLTTESKGRRLFSPHASTSSGSTSNGLATLEISKGLQIIFEESETPSSPRSLKSSPLSERIGGNLLSPEMKSPIMGTFFSPTSNLPNYVLDGEAPHLRVCSPKRKHKENVNWLTKFRKQKGFASNSDKPAAEEEREKITPKRRLSNHFDSPTTPKTPKTPSSRRNSSMEGGIRRFLCATPTSSTKSAQKSVQNT